MHDDSPSPDPESSKPDNSEPETSDSPSRRTNVQRSATTRKKVLGAAVECLSELGYDGTSVLLVAKKAGVSRGAAQHQFPSKIDMMMAVAQHVVELQSVMRKEMWESLVADGESLSDIVDFSWSLQSQPESIALIEIMLASRNDAELHARFQPLMSEIAELRKSSAARIAALIGAEPDDADIIALVRLHHAAMRGLALDGIVNSEREGLQAAVELLKRYERELITRIGERLGPTKSPTNDVE